MDVSTPPRVDLACSQAEAKSKNMSTCFRDGGVDKIKYGHEGIMIILEIETYINIYCHMISYSKVTICSQCQAWFRNFIGS